MENNFGKKAKKILQGTALAAALSSAPDSIAQTVEPYQSKDDKDYKNRKEMYDDSLHAYNETQKTKELLDADSHEEVFRLAGLSKENLDKYNNLWRLWEDFNNKAWKNKSNPEVAKKYEELANRMEEAMKLIPRDRVQSEIEERFDVYSHDEKDFDFNKKIYTKFPEINKPELSEPSFGQDNNLPLVFGDTGYIKYPIYKKPKQKILKPQKEKALLIPTELNEIEKVESQEILPVETKPETYMMQNGRHYTYEDLIKFFPIMKDPRVFERSFGKKPPHSKQD